MKIWICWYRCCLVLWIGCTLIACGGADKGKPKLRIVSPPFEPIKDRSEDIQVQFKLINVGINCQMSLDIHLKLQNSSCPPIPQGRHDYRLEYYDKTTNTLLAWAEDSFTLGDSDMDISPVLTSEIDDDQDSHSNLDEFVAGTNPNDAGDYPPSSSLTAPTDITKEASAEKTPIDLGEPIVIGFDEASLSINNDAPTDGFVLGETTVSWTATDANNNTKTDTQLIIIEDTTAPVFTLEQLPVIKHETTEDSITLEALDPPPVTDLFPVEVTSNAPSPLTYTVGKHEIIWTATDTSSNTNTKTQTLIVTKVDPPPEPVCNAPANVTIEARDQLTISTDTELGKASDSNFTGEVTVSHDVPATGFVIGEHTVTWTCADNSTEKTATQKVSIQDTTPPVFTLEPLPDIKHETTEETITLEALDPPAVTDLFPVEVTSNAPSPLTYTVGKHEIVWTATDTSSNTSTQTQTLIVTNVDLPPDPVCNAPANVTIEARDQLTIPTDTELGEASGSNFTGEVTVSHDVPATGFVIGEHTVTWTCTDNSTEKTATQTLTIKNVNPMANAGIDQMAQVGDVVELDASASSDPNKDDLSYLWMAPEGIDLSSTTTAQPSFTVATGTKVGVLTFDLDVSDGQNGTDSDSVDIDILNTEPSAMAGSDRTIIINNQVNLDGSASRDVNGDTLTYHWSVGTAPSGSTATLVDANIVTASFTPDVLGSYTLQLEVKDALSSTIDSLVLTVIEVGAIPQPTMVKIPGGEFQMGDESSSDGTTKGSGSSAEVPVHTVRVATFEMGKYEVTFAEYDEYLKNRAANPISDPSTIPSLTCCDEASDAGWGRASRPVIQVSWDDIQAYLQWLNTQQGIALDDPQRYRLPTEAEWEYAARGGTTTAYSTGDCIEASQANYDDGFSYSYTKKDGTAVDCPKTSLERKKTESVGSFVANLFGLHDMHGNVAEWVEDCWHENYTGALTNGRAWVATCTDSHRVLRGGSWLDRLWNLRSANRLRLPPVNRSTHFGFRLARTLLKPEMVKIPGGEFQMGDETSTDGTTKGSGNSTEVPVHTVTVAAFEMGKYEVTFAEYDHYLISKGIDTNNITHPWSQGYDQGWGRGLRPVINISWNDIQAYLKWLNTQEGIALDDPKRYRLPTEAEWEYAARGGTTTAYSWGDTVDHDKANYGSCCGGLSVTGTRDVYLQVAPVGQFLANPFGLHDMHGNVSEWVEDCWHNNYTGAPLDGRAWVTDCTDSSHPVSRGGSWASGSWSLRSASRSIATGRRSSSGFRLARTL